ncbi:MAG: DUF933 domain-containing protein [bacterium]|nr:DUF933 domain-containing protein [bacterium]
MKIVITGFGGSGRTSLFAACTGKDMEEASRQSIGVVQVPDERLNKLSAIFNPKKTVFTTIDFVDSLPLDSHSKSDKTSLFETLRNGDALVCVISAFQHDSDGEILDELNRLRLDILINDLDMAVKRSERLEKEIRICKDKGEKQKELALVKRIQPVLENEQFLYSMDFDKDELMILRNFGLLSRKPCIYVLNCSEEMDAERIAGLEDAVRRQLDEVSDPSPVISLNASIEAEIAAMDSADREDFLKEYGISECGRDKLIKAVYRRIDYITFFTVGEDECRSWKIPAGSTAVDAARAIHSDLARGFIRAEVVSAEDLLRLGSHNEAKKEGVLRLEGKTYLVKDGDTLNIMFNI